MKKYFEKMAEGEGLPLLEKPCHDCAVTTGFYTPYAVALLDQDTEIQDKVLGNWFCHNHPDKACRGAYNYVHANRKSPPK